MIIIIIHHQLKNYKPQQLEMYCRKWIYSLLTVDSEQFEVNILN